MPKPICYTESCYSTYRKLNRDHQHRLESLLLLESRTHQQGCTFVFPVDTTASILLVTFIASRYGYNVTDLETVVFAA